jgi:4-diphosphocytidyl-2-C-methyl-D-erythritol kinase
VRVVEVRAHAKINLDLRIVGRRPDGFHELRTVFQSIALYDTLVVRAVRGVFGIACNMPGVPIDRTNLVWRAADALWKAAGRRGRVHGASIELKKRIPPEAGLGGGSSDAAATLVALNALWRLRLSPDELHAVAASIGSDVPFFLVGGTALGLGRGEELYALPDIAPASVVLVRPPFGVSTADAYSWYRSGVAAPSRRRTQRVPLAGKPSMHTVVNHLEPAVIARHPEIARIRRQLAGAGAFVSLMSGSGSAVFGLFADPDKARAAAARFARPGWQTVLTRTVRRSAAVPAISARIEPRQ